MALFDITEPAGVKTGARGSETLKTGKPVGIDLGTTRSVVGYVDADEQVRLCADEAGQVLHPCVIEGVSSFKRLMGLGVDDAAVKAYAMAHGVEVSGRSELVHIKTKRSVKNPVELSAAMLSKLKSIAEKTLKSGQVQDAVITVPAYFNESQRQATKNAAALAGLNVLRLMSEPTAAALAYGLNKDVTGTYLVYDLGGGTFDISLLKLTKGVFKVIATGGDSHLGGDDIDAALAGRFSMSLDQAREVKEKLSTLEKVDGISQEDLAQIAAPLIDQTIQHVKDVLFEADVEGADLDGLILVGGSTRMPVVKDAVQKAFPEMTVYDDVNPDEVVARGAALQAHALSTGSAKALLLDITPLSLGIETMGGLVEKIMPRNTPIPMTRAQVFTTFKDGQNAMDIHVLQGERETVEGCRSLAKFKLSGIPPMAAGLPRIQVTFMLDADGLLTVTAQEKSTSVFQTVEVVPSYGIDEKQMVTMLKSSIIHAKEDVTQRMLLEARLELQQVIDACQQILAAEETHVTDAEARPYKKALVEAEKGLALTVRDDVQQVQEDLEQAFAPLSERRVNAALKQALVGEKV